MIPTDTRTAPAAWAVQEVRERDAFKVAEGRYTSVGREPVTPMTEAEIMAEAARIQAAQEAFEASPKGRIQAAINELREVGSGDVAHSLQVALDSSGFRHQPIDPRNCGWMLKVLDGMNTSTARAIIQAIGENLRGLG